MKRISSSSLLATVLACASCLAGWAPRHSAAPPAAREASFPVRVALPVVPAGGALPVSVPAAPALAVDEGRGFTAIAAWADSDPAEAGAWLRFRSDDRHRERALAAVLARWLSRDPRAAADFVLSLPDAPARTRGLEQVASTWAALDPVALSVWAEALPPCAELDAVAAELATLPALASTRPETALGWADSIVNDQLREQSICYVLASAETALAAVRASSSDHLN